MDRQRDKKFLRSLNSEAYRRIMNERSNLVVFNTETGEVASHYEPAPIYTENQKRALKGITELDVHQAEHGGFVNVFFEQSKTMLERIPELTQSDMARLLFLATYTSYPDRDSSYGYLRHDNGHYISKKGMFELLKMSRNKFDEFYKKIVDCGIIEEDEEKLAVNPGYFYRGDFGKVKPIVNDFQNTRVFRKTVRELYREYNGRQIKQLGLIYAVLPFVNFKYNIISHNPDEQVSGYVKPMRLGELADKLGYAKASALKTALRAIRYDGKPIFQFVEDESDSRKRKVIINPSVVFASNNETLEAIKVLFND
ncbi:hypothetical protein [Bacillus gobiensis]|uniref:Uncharacterized protein n=1 Tax=Bacillus gobiensis TaxID=1441095 RepID=A0A0M5JA03_9BACI|nr:hypothetical protein [Bacillus gobiensis]ALC81551.1 hypothetical protein AM592_08025 [Bacillus gobiensis]